jgi:hypothetical protein
MMSPLHTPRIVAATSCSGLAIAQPVDFAQTRARLCRNASKNGAQSTRSQKQQLTCENIQEVHGFIVAELSFLVHFGVLLFPRFTYGNYAAKLVH